MTEDIKSINLSKAWSRESAIRRDALGRWFNGDEPIEHPQIVRAFNCWIDRADDGRYCLKNAIDWAYVSIEGAPLFVRSVRIESADKPRIILSDESQEQLDPSSLRQDEKGVLYCDARGGGMSARFDRHAMAQLEHLIGEDEQGVYLQLGSRRVRPPTVSEPLRFR